MIQITSKDNSRLKAVRALVRSKKERQKRGCFVIEGVRALRAMTDGTALPHYCLKEVWISGTERALHSAPRAEGGAVPVYKIPHECMEQLSDCRTSQGVLGVVDYTPVPLEMNPHKGNYLLLDRVMDPGNMGTLIRSAVAFGFDGVLLHGDGVEVFNPKTVRATMGALPFCNFQTLEKKDHETSRFQAVEKMGYELIVTELRGGENLYNMKFGSKNVLVIGNEANGVDEELLRKADRSVSIPMSGEVESLNAAVAGSICMSTLCSC